MLQFGSKGALKRIQERALGQWRAVSVVDRYTCFREHDLDANCAVQKAYLSMLIS